MWMSSKQLVLADVTTHLGILARNDKPKWKSKGKLHPYLSRTRRISRLQRKCFNCNNNGCVCMSPELWHPSGTRMKKMHLHVICCNTCLLSAAAIIIRQGMTLILTALFYYSLLLWWPFFVQVWTVVQGVRQGYYLRCYCWILVLLRLSTDKFCQWSAQIIIVWRE